MISTGDAFATYGAVLATMLAVIQYRQWGIAQEILTFKSFENPVPVPALILATITNITSHIVYLEFVGIGYSYRSYSKPWKVRSHHISFMKISEGGFATEKGASGSLEPGNALEVYLEKKECQKLERPTRQTGFDIRLCAWIDHSRSDHIFRKVID